MDFSTVNFMDYLPTYLITGVMACYCVGMLLKMSSIPDRFIPISLFIACISVALALTIANIENTVTLRDWIYGVMYGIMIWGITIGINQTKKQLIDKKDE